MECPECGGPLDAYVLGGREASICERCEWVGIEADHRGEGAATESWDDALDRFYERHVTTERRRSDLPSVAAATEEDRAAATDGRDGEGEVGGDPADGHDAADEVGGDPADGHDAADEVVGDPTDGRDADDAS